MRHGAVVYIIMDGGVSDTNKTNDKQQTPYPGFHINLCLFKNKKRGTELLLYYHYQQRC